MEDLSRPSESRHLRTFEWQPSHGPTFALVTAVAAEQGTAPATVDPLHDTVDTDALESLFGERGVEDVAVRFTYQGYEIHLEGTGRGHVYDGPEYPQGTTESETHAAVD